MASGTLENELILKKRRGGEGEGNNCIQRVLNLVSDILTFYTPLIRARGETFPHSQPNTEKQGMKELDFVSSTFFLSSIVTK